MVLVSRDWERHALWRILRRWGCGQHAGGVFNPPVVCVPIWPWDQICDVSKPKEQESLIPRDRSSFWFAHVDMRPVMSWPWSSELVISRWGIFVGKPVISCQQRIAVGFAVGFHRGRGRSGWDAGGGAKTDQKSRALGENPWLVCQILGVFSGKKRLMFQKSQDSELKVVKLLTEPLNDSEKREREREINSRNGDTLKWVADFQCKSNSELQHFKGDSPQSLGDLNCNKFWCVAPIEHLKQSLADVVCVGWNSDTAGATVAWRHRKCLSNTEWWPQLVPRAESEGAAGSGQDTCLDHDHVKLCFFLLSIDAKLWANLFGKGHPFWSVVFQGRGSEDAAIASWFETAWRSQQGATAKRRDRKGGGDHVDSRKVLACFVIEYLFLQNQRKCPRLDLQVYKKHYHWACRFSIAGFTKQFNI